MNEAKIPHLYKIPYRVAVIIGLIAIAMIIGGLQLSGPGNNMNGFGLIFIGFFLVIVAIIIWLVYLSQERQYRNALQTPLLDYMLDAATHAEAIAKNSAEIKEQNKAALLIMLFFCGLIAIGGLFFGEDGYLMSAIAVGLAVFLSLMAWIITSYRVAKLQRSNQRVLLSLGGALVSDEFHNWSTMGNRLESLTWQPGDLAITYSYITRAGRQSTTIHLAVPPGYENAASLAVTTLIQHYQLSA